MEEQLLRFPMWDEPIFRVNFRDFFQTKGIAYNEDEIRLAQVLTWDGVKGSLPHGVGSLQLRDFYRDGTLWFVENFEGYLLPEELRTNVAAPKVMVAAESWEPLCKGLCEHNVCEVYTL